MPATRIRGFGIGKMVHFLLFDCLYRKNERLTLAVQGQPHLRVRLYFSPEFSFKCGYTDCTKIQVSAEFESQHEKIITCLKCV